ncbi:hypothetical protein BDF14DRAFT_1848978 [Spinellus fusiger]|nr:hypothetical protein BDF14DRAFT_1848978 [Spinellus fusiger]
MDYYTAATDCERQGQIGKALELYRRAFKLNPNIDFDYKHSIHSSSSEQQRQDLTSHHEAPFRHIVPIGNEYQTLSATRKDPLEDLILQFQQEPTPYIPAVDYKPILIAKLPGEVFQHILRHLLVQSLSSVASVALVCKNFFLLTRSYSLWRFACEHAFQLPGMTYEQCKKEQTKQVLVYGGHWMRMLIERPRIRYDGVYISIGHYIRPGTSENAWSQVIHVVTYYRYLRFFPDGSILQHVTTEEPIHVVKLLVPQFTQKQTFRGHFELDKDRILIRMRDPTIPQEDFTMNLTIKGTHRGRHNKLTWINYYSNKMGSDEIYDYDLKPMKPYFFSTVRSYTQPHISLLHTIV